MRPGELVGALGGTVVGFVLYDLLHVAAGIAIVAGALVGVILAALVSWDDGPPAR